MNKLYGKIGSEWYLWYFGLSIPFADGEQMDMGRKPPLPRRCQGWMELAGGEFWGPDSILVWFSGSVGCLAWRVKCLVRRASSCFYVWKYRDRFMFVQTLIGRIGQREQISVLLVELDSLCSVVLEIL